jgi:L-fuconolactonase
MRIDSHHHVWDLDVRPQPWTASFPLLARSYSMDDLRPSLLASGIDATVVVQTVTVAQETPELLELAARDPAVVGVVGWVDLAARDVFEKLAQLREGPNGSRLVGIRHQVQEEKDLDWIAREKVRAGLRAVCVHDLAYDLVIRREQLPSAVAAAEAVPELRFILDHGGNPAIEENELEPWRRHVSALAALPNTAVKLSGLATRAGAEWSADDLRPYVNHLFSAFGASRVLFGSDWPVCLLRASYEQTVEMAEELTAELNSSERYDVFGGNAVSWYQLAP